MSTYAIRSRDLLRRLGGPRRRCDACGVTLARRRSHGFVSQNGRFLTCGDCAHAARVHVPERV